MDIAPKIVEGRQVVEAYDDEGFRINGARHEGSMLIWPESTAAWEVAGLADAVLETLAPLLAAEPPIETLLIGTGARFHPAPRALKAALAARRIAVESMDTGAACRTYNVLLAEERRVAAALLPAKA